MFMGEYEYSLDAKGRVILPPLFRETLDEQFILTRGLDGCIFGYPLDEWQKLEAKLKALPLTKKDVRAFIRFFYSAATPCELDKQGRVKVPASLIKHAALEKQCVVAGVSTRFEIWSDERWGQFIDSTSGRYDDLAENILNDI